MQIQCSHDMKIETTHDIYLCIHITKCYNNIIRNSHLELYKCPKKQIPHVVAAVKNDVDYKYAKFDSGLPFFDVMLLRDLPKSASLPVATVQNTKARLLNGTWDFDYIYFTESDQVI